MPIDKSKKDQIECDINCEKNLIPPIIEGETLGNIKLHINEEQIYNVNIVLKKSIFKKQFLDYFNQLLKVKI